MAKRKCNPSCPSGLASIIFALVSLEACVCGFLTFCGQSVKIVAAFFQKADVGQMLDSRIHEERSLALYSDALSVPWEERPRGTPAEVSS